MFVEAVVIILTVSSAKGSQYVTKEDFYHCMLRNMLSTDINTDGTKTMNAKRIKVILLKSSQSHICYLSDQLSYINYFLPLRQMGQSNTSNVLLGKHSTYSSYFVKFEANLL